MKDRDIDALAGAYERLRKRSLRLKLVDPTKMPKSSAAAGNRWMSLFERAKDKISVLKYLADGGNPETLRRALARGAVEIVKPAKKKTSRYPKATKTK